MDMRFSAGLLWRRLLLAGAAVTLAACVTEMAEVQPAPTPAPPVVASPAPPPPAPTPVAPQAEQPRPVEAPPPPAPTPVAPQAEQPRPVEAPPPPVTPPPVAAAPAPPPAPAALRGPVEVTGVDVRGEGAGGMTVVVTGDGPIPTYESFTLPDPPRLVLDIPNANHAIPQPIAAQSPAVKAIRSSQYRERPVKIVRLVIDLRSALPYRIETAGNQLRVQLGAPGGSDSTAQAAAPAPAAAPASTGKVTRVSVQNARGRQRILIGTSGRVAYNVTQSSDPPSLTVDVTGATIDTAAARSLDLRQVASSVSRLRASQYRTEPDHVVRIVADLRNPTGYEVQQTDSAILVDLQAPPARATAAPRVAAQASTPPPAPAPAENPAALPPPAAPAPPPPPAATPTSPGAGRLSMDFKDADINNLLRIIAEVSGMNVVAGSDVSGRVTVRLVNVEWQQALDVILKINSMGYEIDGNIIRVAPLAKLSAERKAREETRSAAALAQRDEQKTKNDLEPLETQVIPVNYAKAVEVVKNLDRLKTTGRTDTSIAVDDRTNKLIIKETRETLDKMTRLLKQLDLATPQVLIEARLVEATRTFSQSLGIEWGFASSLNLSNLQAPPVSVFGSQVLTPITAPGSPGSIPIALSLPANPAAVGVGIVANNLFNNRLALQTRLSAGEADGRSKTLSAPRVATLDNQEAEIKQGSQIPYTTVDSSGRTVVAFQDAFIRLKVTPHITNDRRVSLKVEAEKTDPDRANQVNFAGGFAIPLSTRKATTNVLITNGGTIVIGGLLATTDSTSESGIPWLMRVPVLGMLFKNQIVGPNGRTELLIFLTPTILEEPRLS